MPVHQVLVALLILCLLRAPWLPALQEPAPAAAPAAAQAAPKKPAAKRTRKTTRPKAKPAPKPLSSDARQAQQAFVSSTELKPMARQLLDSRSKAAYAGVEAYALRHASDNAGAMAWLVIGYARTLDQQYGPAIDALRQARPHAGVLGDYVDYLLGSALVANRSHQEALEVLRDFDTRYPDSTLVHDALLLEADALLAVGRAKEAAALLEAHRTPARPDTELTLARAYSALGENERAAQALRLLYFTMPLSPLADEAQSQLQALARKVSLPAPTYEQRKTRAQLLSQARQYQDAAAEYRALLPQAPASELATMQIALGEALYRSRRYRDARDVLERVPASTADNGQRLYYLAELVHKSDSNRYLQLLEQLRKTTPKSPYLAQILLNSGNAALLRKDFPEAIRFYQEIYKRAPEGKVSDYAHWKVAWLNFRLGNTAEAKRLFEEQVALYPSSNQAAAAIYWRARLAEEDYDLNKARVWYQKLSQRFRLYYYGELARERLKIIGIDGNLPLDPLLEKIPAVAAPPGLATPFPPEDPHAQRARLLENAALWDFAMRELQEAANHNGGGWALREMVRIYEQSDRYYRGLQVLKRALPSYFALDIGSMPRDLWEGLFPRIYWTDLKRASDAQQLDPFLVAAIIRQESEFNPNAVSRAKAMGLMQLLPSTGRKLAREAKIRHYSSRDLFEPDVNMQLGTVYFRRLLDQYGGTLEYALAAYNAGDDRVADWRAAGQYRDVAEFVESIPFTETRDYVQAILRNVTVYRRLYGNP